MTKEQRELTWQSAGHWLDNYNHPHDAVTNASGCPLCTEYGNAFRRNEPACNGCPVMESVGNSDCVGTPWKEAHLDILALQNDGGGDGRMDSAEAEYRFLVELALTP